MRRRRAVEKSDDDDDDPDDLDDDLLDEEEGDNEVEAQAASMSGLEEGSGMFEGLPCKGEDAMREVRRQRNLEQALFIQMEMQKKLHEQLEVMGCSLPKTYISIMPQLICLTCLTNPFPSVCVNAAATLTSARLHPSASQLLLSNCAQ